MLKDFDINDIQDLQETRDWIVKLFNIIETLNQENLELKTQFQQVRDENNRLKGEQPKPKIKPNRETSNHSSEKERNRPKEREKSSKKDRIKFHDTEVCRVDTKLLPKDAQFKGHERVIAQNIKFEARNILFLKEKYYSPSQNKTYFAPVPPGYHGEFDPAKKLGVNFYDYIYDRISGAYEMPAMADVITQRSKDLQLGASWDATP